MGLPPPGLPPLVLDKRDSTLFLSPLLRLEYDSGWQETSRVHSAVQGRVVLCGAVQCSVVLCGAVLCGVVLCGAVQCSVIQCSAVQCGAVQ